MEHLDLENLTAGEIQLIQKSIIEQWPLSKLKAEYLTPEQIELRIRNNKARAGDIGW